MAKSIPAIVTPEVLKWARTLDLLTIEEIANKMKVSSDKVKAWEDETEMPTLVQAKKLAKQYRIPFAYFYLPDTPQKTKRLEKVDYRTFGNIGPTYMSRELRWFLRDIEERRDIMLEIYSENDEDIASFTDNFDINLSTEKEIANAIRGFLKLTEDTKKAFRKPECALSHCIARLENYGFLVFQATKIEPSEMRGLSVAYEKFPIIALNRKDEYSARLFTLMHELVHVFTRTSGICNEIGQDLTQNQIELKCNRIAGLILVPDNMIKANENVLFIKKYGLDDTYVNALARDFAVSKEVVINRLWSIGVINKTTYFDTLKRYTKEYQEYKKNKKSDGFPPPAVDKGSQVGKLYAKTVLEAYHSETISSRDASNYLLGLRTQHFNALERWCF